ncbi:MAG: hypothetical protein KDB39_13330 [Austwickia sp.]|nr:hypothetical protein [Austwickia sp.]
MSSAADGPDRPIAADWLALRRALDERARAAADGLLTQVAEALTGPPGGLDASGGTLAPAPVRVVDVGAGTGANRAYLEPRLPFPTEWTLLDHDPALLAAPDNDGTRRVLGGVEQLAQVLAGLAADAPAQPRWVTCSALLDLLTAAQLDQFVEAVAAARVPALCALTVTGVVAIDPADPDDELVRTAFDAHQARSERCGPGAAAYAARAANAAGLVVRQVSTPWRVGADPTSAGDPTTAGAPTSESDPTTRAFLHRYLSDRAAAAAEHLDRAGGGTSDEATSDEANPGAANDATPAVETPTARVAGWLDRRLAAVAAGRLSLRVDHVDLLLLPPR